MTKNKLIIIEKESELEEYELDGELYFPFDVQFSIDIFTKFSIRSDGAIISGGDKNKGNNND